MIPTSWATLREAASPRLRAWLDDHSGTVSSAVLRGVFRAYGRDDGDAGVLVSDLVDVQEGARKHLKDLGGVDSRAHALMLNAVMDRAPGDLVLRAFYFARNREGLRDPYGEQLRKLDIPLLLQTELTARDKGRKGPRLVVDADDFAQALGNLVDNGFRPPWLDRFLALTGWTMNRAPKAKAGEPVTPTKGHPVRVPFEYDVVADAPVGSVFVSTFPGNKDSFIVRAGGYFASPAAATGGYTAPISNFKLLVQSMLKAGTYEEVQFYLALRGTGKPDSNAKITAWRDAALEAIPSIPDAEGHESPAAKKKHAQVQELATLYGEAIKLAEARPAETFWSGKLPNILGFLRDLPGQPYYRVPPAGAQPAPVPSAQDLAFRIEELKRIVERLKAPPLVLEVLRSLQPGDTFTAAVDGRTGNYVVLRKRGGTEVQAEADSGAVLLFDEDSLDRGTVNRIVQGRAPLRVTAMAKTGHRDLSVKDPLVALREVAPQDLGAYGGLAWALSKFVQAKTGVAVPSKYWTTTWHWPLGQFADRLSASLQDVTASLLGAEQERAAVALRNAEADLHAVRNAERAVDDLLEFPLDRTSLAEWFNAKRGKAKWTDPGFAAVLHSYASDLKEQIAESLKVRARKLEALVVDARNELLAYMKTTKDMESDVEYMGALRRALGLDADPFVAVVARREAKTREHAQSIADMTRIAQRAVLPEAAEEMYAKFLAEGHPRAYGESKAVIEKGRAILAKPPPVSSKPIAYVYDRYNGVLQVWPVLSVADARVLFDQRQAQPGNRDINAIALQGQKFADAVEVTKKELVKKGREVLEVQIHPVWKS